MTYGHEKWETYLAHTDYPIGEPEKEKEKQGHHGLWALPEDHLANFHKMMMERRCGKLSKSRIGGNVESKKMQRSHEDAKSEVLGLYLRLALLLHPLARQNVAFVFENIAATNDDSTSYDVSNSSGHNSQCEHPSSYSFLANQSSFPQLDHEDLK
ncbi:hypothetical protein Tco_0842261 [Tanacetum coccineum]|uniref:Uncharacterized protein n=1 Tax=Tanacetum coccineum TaxID=301880 RepID=A0ABQ5B347_9ASTR